MKKKIIAFVLSAALCAGLPVNMVGANPKAGCQDHVLQVVARVTTSEHTHKVDNGDICTVKTITTDEIGQCIYCPYSEFLGSTTVDEHSIGHK